MKVCSTCKKEKPASEFQKRDMSRDGLTASCRDCLKERDRARYPTEKQYRAEKHKAYMGTPEAKASHSASAKKWREENRVKRAAHVILGHAIRKGTIKRLPCFVCGSDDSHGHHPDYSTPLDVIWLCADHHKQAHAIGKKITKACLTDDNQLG